MMQAVIEGRAVIMVFLDSKGKQSRTADAGRMRKWLEALKPANMSLPGGQKKQGQRCCPVSLVLGYKTQSH